MLNVLNLLRVITLIIKYRELGIGIVPYSPLGRGFFGGKAVVESLPSNSDLLVDILVMHSVIFHFFGRLNNSSHLLKKLISVVA